MLKDFIEHLSSFGFESVLYLFCVSVFQGIPFIAVVALLVAPYGLLKGWFRYTTVMLRVVAFNLLLLGWGCLGNYAWAVLAHSRLYPPCDDPPLVYWSPYEPHSLDYSSYHCTLGSGNQLTITDPLFFQLNLLLTIATWMFSFCSFFFLCRYTPYFRTAWHFMVSDD